MDVGDFVGDSDEDSGVEDAFIEQIVPALVEVEPSMSPEIFLQPEIRSTIRGTSVNPSEDAPQDDEMDSEAVELPVPEAIPAVSRLDEHVLVEEFDSPAANEGKLRVHEDSVMAARDDRVEGESAAPQVDDDPPIARAAELSPTEDHVLAHEVSEAVVETPVRPASGLSPKANEIVEELANEGRRRVEEDYVMPNRDGRAEDESEAPQLADAHRILLTAQSTPPRDDPHEGPLDQRPVQPASALSPPVNESVEEKTGPRAKFKVGDIVHVAARTWPGINKLGGAGKIASVISDSSAGDDTVEFLYNVKYMLGGFEKRIEEEYIQDLADALETGVRQHKERVFYHDEFAVNHKKAKPLELERGEFWPQPQGDTPGEATATPAVSDPSSAPPPKPSKKKRDPKREKPVLVDAPEIEFQMRSSDDSDYDGSNDDAEVDKQNDAESRRRLGDDAFILDERHTAATQRKPRSLDPEERKRRREKKLHSRRRDKRGGEDAAREQSSSKTSARKKRSHRIVESDEEEQDVGAERRHWKKKRRYIGGYEHGSEDADGSFIQPEGNPTELPDDVAQELQFTLGKTKAELRVQLDEFADRLLKNLSDFEEKRKLMSRQLKHAATLQDGELQDIDTTLRSLQAFIRTNLIRSGEDAMNAVIKKLERKGGTLPERIDVRLDDWLRKIADHDTWVKQNLRALETTFARRGIVSTVSEEPFDEETSSESDEGGSVGSDSFNYSGDDFIEPEPTERGLPRRHEKSTSGQRSNLVGGSRTKSAESNQPSKKRPRSAVQTQSSMDNFAVPFDERRRREQFDRPSAPVMSNFRFVREKDLLKRTTDPRWDWVRKLKRSRARELVNPRGGGFHQTRESWTVTKNARESQKAVSVMEAVFKLRDKRHRARASPQNYPPYQREARSTLLPKPMPLLQQSNSYAENFVEYEEPIRFKQPPVQSKPSSQDMAPQLSSRKWSSIFSVLPNEETLPASFVASPSKLMQLGRVFYADQLTRDEDDCWLTLTKNDRGGPSVASALVQKLNQLRFEEQKAIAAVSKSANSVSVGEHPDWIVVSTLGDEYHTDLASFIEGMQRTVHEAHPSTVVSEVKSMVAEIANLLKQIPDCNSIFSASPEYGYYFEVVCPGARSTPVILAICRTFWYALQGLVYVKRICEKHWPDEAVHWSELFLGTLPLNRVALAACLFLVDLFIHVHSTHHIPDESVPREESSDVEAPALSLWLLLHELFSVGCLQSTKGTEAKASGGFWNFLQEAYRRKFVEEVALSFVKQESCCGYVKERAPAKSQDNQKSVDDYQGRLLANDTLWDICGVLGNVFHSTSYPTLHATPSTWSSWTLANELLSSGNIGFVPLEGLTATDTIDDEFKVQAYGFQIRILRRILVFSATSPPDKDFVEKLVPLLWEGSQVEANDQAMLAVVNFIGEIRTLDVKRRESLLELASRHASETTDPVALFCKIAVIQLAKQDKAILRSRFRQPVLRALSGRLESQKDIRSLISQSAQQMKIPEPVETAKKDSNKSWNWGKSGSKAAPPANTANHSPTAVHVQVSTPQREQIVAESKAMLSILLMFALASIYLEDESSTAQQAARRQKELKREIEYFCKEFCSAGSAIPAVSVQLCQCIHAIGVAALDARSSYSTTFEQLSSQLKWISDELQQMRRVDADGKRRKTREWSSLSAGVSACLEALRDLSSQLVDRLRVRRDVDPAEIDNVQSCVASALGSGIAASLELAADGALSRSDFEKTIKIVSLWLPRSRDTPSQSLRYGPSLQASSSQQDEFDEFDDAEMMDLLATVDLVSSAASTTDYEAFLRTVDAQASDLAIANLRLPLQRLLISLPQKIWRSYEELYLMDLLGALVASCSFTFSWSVVSMASLKPRNFAPRLLSAILKHRPEKEWFSTCFLSEQNADVELSNIWLTATLDLQSLRPQKAPVPATQPSNESPSQKVISARYSSYWLMLTDGILANLLKENPVVRYKMDQVMYQLLHDTATRCSFRQSITRNADPTDTTTLYIMHEDVFRAFCRSAGHIWTSMTADPARYRADMNRFRSKMMDGQRGVFGALPDAYEINLRAVCTELDSKNINWYSLSSRFLDEFTAPQGTKSLHSVDDAATVLDRELKDPVIRPLVVLFKLMYDCVDAFLFNCGGMAIGQQNIFYSIIELMFRQARCAEFPVAERRLKFTSNSHASIVTRPAAASGIQGVSPACAGFVESARLFFAYQKYPSLMNWFAQNLETYQTLKAGWDTSPLRVLLYNIFDPHGPLGIHSYYPIQENSSDDTRFEPSTIRREAFYLSCGLINCRCTSSYEHTRHVAQEDQEHRRAQLRQFVLTRFVDELKRSVQMDGENIDETLLPVFQFVKALVNHLNLDECVNVQAHNGRSHGLWLLQNIEHELLPGLVSVAEHITEKLKTDSALAETMSCVLMIEFCRIIEEVACLNATIRDAKLVRFVEIGLRCASFAYESLRKYSSTAMEDLFADAAQLTIDALAGGLRELAVQDTVVKTEANTAKVEAATAPSIRSIPDDYGISKVRVRSDLLASIRQLVKQCRAFGDSSFLRTLSVPQDQASEVGTM